MTKLGALLIALTVIVWAGEATAQESRFVTIGTGGVNGVYYPAGGAICRLVNKDRQNNGIRCVVESTSGSVYNTDALRNGELDLGIVQSDTQYNAYRGERQFKDKDPFKELRALFSLYPEPFTVVARANAGIREFDDLRGKRVNIGNPGSGQRENMAAVMAAKGWTLDDFAMASELRPTEQNEAMCQGKIDAIVYTVGHPSEAIRKVTTKCDAVLVDVSGPAIDKLVAQFPYYRQAVIPGGMYRGNPDAIRTFGVGATVVTSSKTSPEIVYKIVKAVFENFDAFKAMHPAFAHLNKKEMIHEGLSAPLHAGAVRYYKEAGLM